MLFTVFECKLIVIGSETTNHNSGLKNGAKTSQLTRRVSVLQVSRCGLDFVHSLPDIVLKLKYAKVFYFNPKPICVCKVAL